MKTLLILRHARTATGAEIADHERPLDDAGQRDAAGVGRWLTSDQLIPDQILASTAVRARTTADAAARACGYGREPEVNRQLYSGDPEDYLGLLRELPGEVRTAMLVGHNPAVEGLIELLTRRDVRLAPAALARIQLHVERWNEVRPGVGAELLDVRDP